MSCKLEHRGKIFENQEELNLFLSKEKLILLNPENRSEIETIYKYLLDNKIYKFSEDLVNELTPKENIEISEEKQNEILKMAEMFFDYKKYVIKNNLDQILFRDLKNEECLSSRPNKPKTIDTEWYLDDVKIDFEVDFNKGLYVKNKLL